MTVFAVFWLRLLPKFPTLRPAIDAPSIKHFPGDDMVAVSAFSPFSRLDRCRSAGIVAVAGAELGLVRWFFLGLLAALKTSKIINSHIILPNECG